MSDNWISVANVSDIPEDDVIGIAVNGHPIALYNIDGEVFATDDVCTHGQALLSDGFVEDGEIECPLHQGKFCIKSGKAMCDPLETDIKTYQTRVDGEQVLILVE